MRGVLAESVGDRGEAGYWEGRGVAGYLGGQEGGYRGEVVGCCLGWVAPGAAVDEAGDVSC